MPVRCCFHGAVLVQGALIGAIVHEALIQGIVHISLSVDNYNPARHLYVSEGFTKYDTVVNACTTFQKYLP